MSSKTRKSTLDWILISTVLLQLLIGAAFIYSVSGGYDEYIRGNYPEGTYYFKNHCVALLFALTMSCLVFKFCSTQLIEKYAYWLLGLAFVLILATLIPGVGWQYNGMNRSIYIGLTHWHVVPLATLFLIIAACRYIAEHFNHKQRMGSPALKLVVVFFLFALLFFNQPNIKIIVTFGLLLVLLSYSIKHYKLCIANVAALFMLFIWFILLTDLFFVKYTRFLTPLAYDQTSGFQLSASLSTIAGGNLWGVGFGNGLEKPFYFPSAHQGFMFSSITEQVGAVGALFVIACAAMILWRCLRMVPHLFQTNRLFEGLLVTGISGWIGLMTIFHISGCLGIIPADDSYLPFISYDKAYLFACLVGIAIITKIGSTVAIEHEVTNENTNSQPILITFLSLFLTLGIYTYSKAVLDKQWDTQYEKKIVKVNQLIQKFKSKEARITSGQNDTKSHS